MSETLAQRLIAALRTTAQAYAPGDQVAPCAVLWTDAERLWEGVVPQLQPLLPELLSLAAMACGVGAVAALHRVADDAPPAGTIPIFYLPGVSREQLRAAENCTQELAPLVELQYRVGELKSRPTGEFVFLRICVADENHRPFG